MVRSRSYAALAPGADCLMSSPLKRLVGAAGARIAVLPVTALASLAISRTVSTDYSLDVYAIFMLAYTIPALLPSFDFGLGAPVTTATARISEEPDVFKWTLLRATRLLSLAAIVVASVAVVAAFYPGMTALLGIADDSFDSAFLIAILLIALAIATGLGPALLLGLRMNTSLTILQGLSGPLTLCVVTVIVATGGTQWWIVALAPLGLVTINVVIMTVALSNRDVRRALSGDGRAARMAGTAVPMLLILIATPIAIQSGRVALSWSADLHAVAAYSAAFTLFGPAYSVAQIAGRSLWPEFVAVASDKAALSRLFSRSLLVCGLVGSCLSMGFIVVAPAAISAIFPPDLEISSLTWWSMSISILVIAIHQPGAMLLIDERGLRAQAITSMTLAGTVLACTILLAERFKDAAPAISLALAFFVCQFLPVLALARRRLRN